MADITIKDIAKRCGVSVSTVSRALNDNAEINAETKAMILRVVQEMGFVPNNSARNLKRTDTNKGQIEVKVYGRRNLQEKIQLCFASCG